MLPSLCLILVFCARTASAYIVAIPMNAMTHIQKIAPGPPVKIAPEAPTILPVPTWAAMAVARAWKELIPLSCFLPLSEMFPNTLFIPSGKKRIWTNLVLTVYQRPTTINKMTST